MPLDIPVAIAMVVVGSQYLFERGRSPSENTYYMQMIKGWSIRG